jgi:hypothetical protein
VLDGYMYIEESVVDRQARGNSDNVGSNLHKLIFVLESGGYYGCI